MDKKQEFLDLYDKYIKRDGADELKKYLMKSDFFTAPASSKYHCNHEGGLCEHSVNTFYRLLKNVQNEYGKDWEKVYSYETIAICGLLHDLCKIDFYKLDYRNVKENGEWVKKPWYTREELLPYGHGEKSVYIIVTGDSPSFISKRLMMPLSASKFIQAYVLSKRLIHMGIVTSMISRFWVLSLNRAII